MSAESMLNKKIEKDKTMLSKYIDFHGISCILSLESNCYSRIVVYILNKTVLFNINNDILRKKIITKYSINPQKGWSLTIISKSNYYSSLNALQAAAEV